MSNQPQQHSLSADQANVLRLLLGGFSVSAAAAHSGVPIELIYHWARHYEFFQAALDAACERRVQDTNEQIHGLYPQALEILKKALLAGEVKPIQLRAAMAILKMVRQDKPEQHRTLSRRAQQELDHQLAQHADLLTPLPPRELSAPVPLPQEALNSKPHPRNLPCPCGSGLKHKRCCGAPTSQPLTQAA